MPFMNIKDGYVSKNIIFDTQDSLDEKLDRVTSMMSKLRTQDDDQKKQFKRKIYQSKRRRKTRNFYDQNYGQRNYQNRYRSNSGDKRISFSGRIKYGWNNRDRPRYNQNYRGDFRRGSFKGNLKSNQNYRDQNYRGGYRRNYRKDNYERGRIRSRERQFSDNIRRNDRSNSRSRSGSRTSTNRDRIRCYKCRECDHFSKDCPTSKVEKESEQIQQMYNMDKEQATLKLLATDPYDSLNRINLIDETVMDHLNL